MPQPPLPAGAERRNGDSFPGGHGDLPPGRPGRGRTCRLEAAAAFLAASARRGGRDPPHRHRPAARPAVRPLAAPAGGALPRSRRAVRARGAALVLLALWPWSRLAPGRRQSPLERSLAGVERAAQGEDEGSGGARSTSSPPASQRYRRRRSSGVRAQLPGGGPRRPAKRSSTSPITSASRSTAGCDADGGDR